MRSLLVRKCADDTVRGPSSGTRLAPTDSDVGEAERDGLPLLHLLQHRARIRKHRVEDDVAIGTMPPTPALVRPGRPRSCSAPSVPQWERAGRRPPGTRGKNAMHRSKSLFVPTASTQTSATISTSPSAPFWMSFAPRRRLSSTPYAYTTVRLVSGPVPMQRGGTQMGRRLPAFNRLGDTCSEHRPSLITFPTSRSCPTVGDERTALTSRGPRADKPSTSFKKEHDHPQPPFTSSTRTIVPIPMTSRSSTLKGPRPRPVRQHTVVATSATSTVQRSNETAVGPYLVLPWDLHALLRPSESDVEVDDASSRIAAASQAP
ncbi:hypothetical protein C8Q76DRAFT_318359 [Earliella scabrosa]|nr:hypothetical protein C8Q76DRAFT_318359 [Earliella scabrosa]